MIFFTVCSTWLTSQNSNIKLMLLRNEGPIKLKFSISNNYSLALHIKHANNASLTKGYIDILEKYRHLNNDFDCIEFENLDFESNGYIEEKRKGGLSSYQHYKPLKKQVEALCKQELAKRNYPSAQQLSMVVASTVIKEFPNLLDSFKPYKNVSA